MSVVVCVFHSPVNILAAYFNNACSNPVTLFSTLLHAIYIFFFDERNCIGHLQTELSDFYGAHHEFFSFLFVA